LFEDGTIINKNSSDDVSIVGLCLLLLKRKKIISCIVGGIIIFTAIILLLTPNQYRSEASILPSGEQDSFSNLKSLAGLGSFVSQDENSSALFPEILRSREITNTVLNTEFSFEDDDGVAHNLKLTEYFNTTSHDLLHSALLGITDISVDKKNGVINVGVTTEYPGFSQKILGKFIEELENFNLYKRASQAKENEKYLANQLGSLKIGLEKLEDEFVQFQKVNRNWLLLATLKYLKKFPDLKEKLK